MSFVKKIILFLHIFFFVFCLGTCNLRVFLFDFGLRLCEDVVFGPGCE